MSIRVCIVLCTKDGGKYLAQQLDSLTMSSIELDIYVNDDNSTDNTLKILKKFSHKIKQVTERNYGSAAKNFIGTLQSIKNDYDFYAFCDQDDIWHENKIELALDEISKKPQTEPSLYCSRTKLVDENGRAIGYSPNFKKIPCFQNALVQSIAGGNTMLFNKRTKELLDCVDISKKIVSHDWLTYLLVSSQNGYIYYDAIPHIEYRQHSKNIIGSNNNFFAKLKRLYLLLSGSFSNWTDSNIKQIENLSIPDKNLNILNQFKKIKSDRLIDRINGLKNSGAFRQHFFSDIMLFLATIFKKL